MRYATLLTPIAFLVMSVPALAKADSKLIHDAEYYLSEAQNAEKWAADDKAVEVKLAQIVQTNGGKRPNPTLCEPFSNSAVTPVYLKT